MFTELNKLRHDTYDFVVIGAGAAGLAAANFATLKGCSVLLVESTEVVGGTSAMSAATLWLPNSHHSTKVNPNDSFENVEKFLDGVVGNKTSKANRTAFLKNAPLTVKALEAADAMQFRPYATHPDYEQTFEGATERGRALEPVPFNGRVLGVALDKIRKPIPEFLIFGGMMIDRTDINHLLGMKKSVKSLLHAAKILSHYALDRLVGQRRGSRLVMGNALIGRLLKSLLDKRSEILLSTATLSFKVGESITLKQGDVEKTLHVSKAIILAAGGFNRGDKRGEFLPKISDYSPASTGHKGEMQALALSNGAHFSEGQAENAFYAPVSKRLRDDGSLAVFPHFVLDRSKPATICVNAEGFRFTNESESYHNFGAAMMAKNASPCYIITDSKGLAKYGLGMVRFNTKDILPYLNDGYLIEGNTIADLAGKLKMPAENLEASILRMNEFAKTGVDLDFGRGTTFYHRVNGDTLARTKNPTLGEISSAPFYAVELHTGDIGAAKGLAVDENAAVLDEANQPIKGLYAVGNEAQSIMGGTYPGPGITLGPALTFAYIAVENALK